LRKKNKKYLVVFKKLRKVNYMKCVYMKIKVEKEYENIWKNMYKNEEEKMWKYG
jgi:hypothetical protein